MTDSKKKQVSALFPQLWGTNTPSSGWTAYASSEFNNSFSAYNVTLPTGEWATAGVTNNFYVTIKMPNYLQGVEPYGFAVKGRSSGENPTNWRFQGAETPGGAVTFLYESSTPISSTETMFFNIDANGIKYKEFTFYGVSGSGSNCGLSEFQVYYFL